MDEQSRVIINQGGGGRVAGGGGGGGYTFTEVEGRIFLDCLMASHGVLGKIEKCFLRTDL